MERHLLVTVSEKYDNLFGVRLVGGFFAEKQEMKVTLFYLTERPPGRFEEDPDREQRIRSSAADGSGAPAAARIRRSTPTSAA